MNPQFKYRRKFFMFPVMVALFLAGGGIAVMLLWNGILPSVITSVGSVTYPQAVGLLVLCRILFGGFKGRGGAGPGHRGGPPWRQRMMNMSEEEREKFKMQWKERCEKK